MTYSTRRPAGPAVDRPLPARHQPRPTRRSQLPRVEAEGVWTLRQQQGLGGRRWPRATRRPRLAATESGFAWGGNARRSVRHADVLGDRLRLLWQGHRHHADVPRRRRRQRLRRGDDLRKSLGGYRPGHRDPGQQQGHPRGQLGHQLPRGLERRARPRISRPRTGWRPAASTSRPPSRSRSSASSTTRSPRTTSTATDKNKEIAPAFGLMLFF